MDGVDAADIDTYILSPVDKTAIEWPLNTCASYDIVPTVIARWT
jgi:hypothetical protein